MPIGGAPPEPGGMFPIFLASLKRPKGALKGSLHSWACTKCKPYMEENVRITPCGGSVQPGKPRLALFGLSPDVVQFAEEPPPSLQHFLPEFLWIGASA